MGTPAQLKYGREFRNNTATLQGDWMLLQYHQIRTHETFSDFIISRKAPEKPTSDYNIQVLLHEKLSLGIGKITEYEERTAVMV